MAKDDKLAAHGLTRGQMKELRHNQALGLDTAAMIPGNAPDAGSYELPDYEKNLVHVELEIPQYDQTTGVKKSRPSTQTFGVAEFEAMKQQNGFAGYTVKILHSPEFAKAQLGVAAEGTRIVDSNYAAMQDRYEALTGTRPDAGLTAAELDAANKAAERVLSQMQGSKLEPIDSSKAEPHRAPVILGTPVGDALAPEQLPVAETPEAAKAVAAEVAQEVAANTAPTQDGTTSVGQETVTAEQVKETQDATAAPADTKEAVTQPSADAGTSNSGAADAAPTTTKRGRPVAPKA
jgi:hypothetical protein